jgi:hypothetical protein
MYWTGYVILVYVLYECGTWSAVHISACIEKYDPFIQNSLCILFIFIAV